MIFSPPSPRCRTLLLAGASLTAIFLLSPAAQAGYCCLLDNDAYFGVLGANNNGGYCTDISPFDENAYMTEYDEDDLDNSIPRAEAAAKDACTSTEIDVDLGPLGYGGVVYEYSDADRCHQLCRENLGLYYCDPDTYQCTTDHTSVPTSVRGYRTSGECNEACAVEVDLRTSVVCSCLDSGGSMSSETERSGGRRTFCYMLVENLTNATVRARVDATLENAVYSALDPRDMTMRSYNSDQEEQQQVEGSGVLDPLTVTFTLNIPEGGFAVAQVDVMPDDEDGFDPQITVDARALRIVLPGESQSPSQSSLDRQGAQNLQEATPEDNQATASLPTSATDCKMLRQVYDECRYLQPSGLGKRQFQSYILTLPGYMGKATIEIELDLPYCFDFTTIRSTRLPDGGNSNPDEDADRGYDCSREINGDAARIVCIAEWDAATESLWTLDFSAYTRNAEECAAGNTFELQAWVTPVGQPAVLTNAIASRKYECGCGLCATCGDGPEGTCNQTVCEAQPYGDFCQWHESKSTCIVRPNVCPLWEGCCGTIPDNPELGFYHGNSRDPDGPGYQELRACLGGLYVSRSVYQGDPNSNAEYGAWVIDKEYHCGGSTTEEGGSSSSSYSSSSARPDTDFYCSHVLGEASAGPTAFMTPAFAQAAQQSCVFFASGVHPLAFGSILSAPAYAHNLNVCGSACDLVRDRGRFCYGPNTGNEFDSSCWQGTVKWQTGLEIMEEGGMFFPNGIVENRGGDGLANCMLAWENNLCGG